MKDKQKFPPNEEAIKVEDSAPKKIGEHGKKSGGPAAVDVKLTDPKAINSAARTVSQTKSAQANAKVQVRTGVNLQNISG